jgi:hypothetical protein
MNQNNITDLPSVSIYRYENFLNVYLDNNGFYFYNLLRSINLFPANNSDLETPYDVSYGDTWGLISYKFYNTMDLWWLVCAYNGIQNPVKMPTGGTQIKILKTNFVGVVLSELNKQINQ